MLFLFKEKPVEIIAFISEVHDYVNTFSPIVPAKEMFPEWWKKIPSSFFNWEEFKENTSVKSCPGVIKMISTGYIMPLWCDIAIEYEKDRYRVNCADDSLNVGAHDNRQSPGLFDNYYHFKLQSPWLLKAPVNLMFTPPTYQFNDPLPYTIMPGIAPPIGGYSASHVFMFTEKKENPVRLMLKHKTPILQIIPLTDKKVKFSTEVVSDKTMIGMKRRTGLTHFTSRGLREIHMYNNMK